MEIMSEVDEMREKLLSIPIVERKPIACCETCACYRQVAKTDYGNCHFDPPVMYYDNLTYTRLSTWPEVHKYNWCKKFESV